MTDRQQTLLTLAQERFGDISPCGGVDSWETCFTEHKGDLMIWFDFGQVIRAGNRSTGCLSERLINGKMKNLDKYQDVIDRL